MPCAHELRSCPAGRRTDPLSELPPGAEADGLRVAHAVAQRYRSSLIEQEEIESAALEGLARALTNYDPTRGASFKTWVGIQARYAIGDMVRRNDPLSRDARRLLAAGGDAGLKASPLPPESLEREYAAGLTIADTLADPAAPDPLERLLAHVIAPEIEQLLLRLPARELALVALHYYAGFTLVTVARIFGVSEHRTSTLHSRALARMRGEPVQAEDPEPERQFARPRTRAGSPLSAREVEVLVDAAAGLGCIASAERRNVAEETIKGHRSHILRKLDVRNMTAAVDRGWRLGLLNG